VFFDPDKLNSSKIIAIVESPEVKIKNDNIIMTRKPGFKVQYSEKNVPVVNLQKFYMGVIPSINDTLNKFEKYKSSDLSVYETSLSEFNKEISDQLPNLESHLSINKGVVRFKTRYSENNVYIQIIFVKSMTNTSDILKLITSPTLRMYSDDGTFKERDNMFVTLIK
jgi:hypothetical protein